MNNQTKKEGTGSIWNVNNWHWENKNYTEKAKAYLSEKLEGHSFKRDDITFTISRLTKVNGEAQINIRKGKQIIIYEFNVDAQFRGETAVDECEGSFKVNDINESDTDFEIASLSITKQGKIGAKAKMIMKKCLRDELIKCVEHMTNDLGKMENDPEKLEADKKKREENDLKVQKIVQEKGHVKEQLLQEQQQKEAELRAKSS